MNNGALEIVILGLSITSSWGNGHATTFRGLVRELHKSGHAITFLERDVPWYASNRDLPDPPFCKTILYNSFEELDAHFAGLIKMADLVIVGSYVPEGVRVGEWVTRIAAGVTAFYDIDTPVTLAKMEKGDLNTCIPILFQDMIFTYRLPVAQRYKNWNDTTVRPTQKRFTVPLIRSCTTPKKQLCSGTLVI
jgi:spore maturation protein CgeB